MIVTRKLMNPESYKYKTVPNYCRLLQENDCHADS